MLLSLAVILLSGFLFGFVCKRIKLPPLVGMIGAGILIGPHCLSLIDGSVLSVSAELRKIALVIILVRAGLKLEAADLKKAGRPAVLMSFLPACFEIAGMILLAPLVLKISVLDAVILGAVVGAVSPAVIVPRMINLIDGGYGTDKAIPQMILAGASVDDVFVIVIFTSFTSLAKGGELSLWSFAAVPVSVILGIAAGLLTGALLHLWLKWVKVRAVTAAIAVLCVSLLMTVAEDKMAAFVPFASLLAVMAAGFMLRRQNRESAVKLSGIFDKLWIPAEVLLFVLLGASVDVESLSRTGILSILLIFGVLVFRMAGVTVCLIKTKLNFRERVFCMLAYTPKATVQAAIGGLPLVMGLSCGETVLTVSVVAILLTAPLGAFAIDTTYKRLLSKNGEGKNGTKGH